MPKKTKNNETPDESIIETNDDALNESFDENQTESGDETELDQQTSADKPAISQTDPEMSEYLTDGNAADAGISDSVEEDVPVQPAEFGQLNKTEGAQPQDTQNESQSDNTQIKKTMKTRKSPESDGNSDADSQSDGKSDTPERIPGKRRARANKIVSIDESRSVETSADKHNNELLDLVESLKSKKILTGTIKGVERSADNPNLSYAVIYHGDFKIVIPAEETIEPPADFRNQSPGDVMHYMVTKRLGAEVDYIVKGVDKSGIAAASRLEAMAAKRKEYYFGADRDGNNLLYEGINAEARIVSVIRAGVFVDLFGLETYIPLRELSYQRGMDATMQFQPGQRVLVKILSIDKSNRNKIKVTASIKQATENP